MAISARVRLETAFGPFDVALYEKDDTHCVVAYRTWKALPYVRLHSQCLFGEAFYSLHCDCRWQYEASMREIAEWGGALVYLFQEGRGIGLKEKIHSMALEQELGINTVEAFKRLGFAADARRYELAAEALRSIGCPNEIRMITNNRDKINCLERCGFRVIERVELAMQLPPSAVREVQDTQRSLGHAVAIFDREGNRQSRHELRVPAYKT